MEKTNELHEQLNSLPTYSLPDKKKEAILQNLAEPQKKQQQNMRVTRLFPSITLMVVLFVLFLFLNESRTHWNVGQNQMADRGELFSASPYQELIGVEGKIGILGPRHFVAEDPRRVAKLMLFFWGTPQEMVSQPYKVEAIHANGEEITLSEGVLSSPLYEEDAHVLTKFTPFPIEGEWQLSFYIGEKVFEEFTIEVLPPFPKTESYTLLNSPKEINPGEETELYIEKYGNGKREITVELRTSSGKLVSTQTFQRDADALHAPTSKKLLIYQGVMNFPKKGKWILVIDGEKTKPFKN
ncbi:hypothetical protein AB1K83_16630 [Sporosarcina sp. 179-K 3D1 HS]|uniref:hypothetical protein n=1 Tax=Sporosarcina sp. 179-K 3D1 HS TaxID=3232169 RepID=UPI0039A1F6FA